ncbi:FAD-dependent oxidoreductase, partial [Archangium sp.]|uniref:FAD-dependent oxidoreductase n=1 Tax=Archangium sp. TaxID=1872627 RepID=UPI002D55A54B
MLAELHGVEEVPRPYTSSHSDWTKDPYGAAWHAWAPGVHLDKLIPAIRKPVDGVPLYICGEAFSGFQGWVEGALWSAEHVLEDYFDLDRPSWLSKDYFIGP